MDGIREYRWASSECTRRAGIALATCLEPGDLIGLIGDLGAGKTLLVQGIAEGLAVPPSVRVNSPTFTLINEYHGGRLPLYHADLYRIKHSLELEEIGLDELVRREDGVVCVEWCDRFEVLGGDYLQVDIRVTGETERVAAVVGKGTRGGALAVAWAAHL